MDPATKLYENAAGVMLPAYRGQGVFFHLMQNITYETNRNDIALYSERAKRIGEIVRSNWENVSCKT